MQRSRVLYYSAERVRALMMQARSDLAALHDRHVSELLELRAEVSELREILSMIVGSLRTQAEADVAQLRRDLERALVRLAQRDPARP